MPKIQIKALQEELLSLSRSGAWCAEVCRNFEKHARLLKLRQEQVDLIPIEVLGLLKISIAMERITNSATPHEGTPYHPIKPEPSIFDDKNLSSKKLGMLMAMNASDFSHSDYKIAFPATRFPQLKNCFEQMLRFKSMPESLVQLRLAHEEQLAQDKKGCFSFFRRTEVKAHWRLEEFIRHGMEKNNRTRQVLIHLNWMDHQGKLTEDAPQDVRRAVGEYSNQDLSV